MSVVRIRDGVEIKPPGEPNQVVIDELERLLEMAKSGELAGLVTVSVWRDECHGSRHVGKIYRATIGELAIVQSEVIAAINRQDGV